MVLEKHQRICSILIELQAVDDAVLPQTTGHLVHAMFLNLIKQRDPALSAHLHDSLGPRPFTLSSLLNETCQEPRHRIKARQLSVLRVTLFDDGQIWQCLSTHILETTSPLVQIGKARFRVRRLLSTPTADTTGWVQTTDWHMLVAQPASPAVLWHFRSPTAFSLGHRTFALVPIPTLLWESLLRCWNAHAPITYHHHRQQLSEILQQVRARTCQLHVEEYQYRAVRQKGFVGTCCYLLPDHQPGASILTTLASFAYYAGVGSKTTMGMGQVTVNCITATEAEEGAVSALQSTYF